MEILQKENPTLRKTSKPVLVEEIDSPKIQNVIENLKKTMHPIKDAVAIAAPQIGELVRIFIVSGIVFEEEIPKEGEIIPQLFKDKDLVCINPKIIKRSSKEEEMEEGCLSVRWEYGKLKRNEKVTLEAYDEHGEKFTRGASGLLAQIFQHETDHLDGILFIDKAKEMRIIDPPETPKQEPAK